MTIAPSRPHPDALLRRIREREERAGRAKLRIYFGYAPGVGKTFAMLSFARGLMDEKKDLIVGLVETHGRYDTAAQVLGLPMLPRRGVEYRGRRLEEFDLDAALARKPAVLLLDELAHTNAPGARHPKRWQDALELLDRGIDVHTTMNVQHVESLNDVVAQITGVRVRETVPDALLDRADEIELIDVPPDELAKRLREGHVYLPEQASRAAQNFFRRGNLLALRELALRRVADRVDREMLAHREEHAIEKPWATQERILVAIGPSPASARLARAAFRMAAGLRAPWIAAYVDPDLADDGARDRLTANLKLAESLGAEIVRLAGKKISAALLDHARRTNVTRVVIGKPTHSRLRDLLRGSLLDEIVRGSGDIDVHVISGDTPGMPEAPPVPQAPPGADWRAYGFTGGLVLVGTIASAFAQRLFELPDMAMLYLAIIMIAAARYGRGPSLLASVLSVAAYDFFFTEPHFTLAVSDVKLVLTFATMFGVGLFISALTLRIRRQEREAREREERTAGLYALSRDLGAALDEGGLAAVIARQAESVFHSPAAVVVPTESGAPRLAGASGNPPFAAAEEAVARFAIEHDRSAGFGTETLPGATVTCLPLSSAGTALGVLMLAAAHAEAPLSSDRHFRDAFLRQCAIALERTRLAEEAKAAMLRARTEEMRSSLLSAVSHDLRTPLAAITGAATVLRDEATLVTGEQQHELVDTICEEAVRLERLVSNLLDMTRLESGAVRVKREWVPLEELVEAATTRLEKQLSGRSVGVDVPPDIPLVSVDPVLVEQVFVNLLENAAKYTPASTPIDIRARLDGAAVVIEVMDRGPGLAPGIERRVFEKFYRAGGSARSGVGLGLAIVKGIVDAHGGSISARNRDGGGTVFRVELPSTEEPPAMPTEDEPALAGEETA
jgi:two-component system sensor histidine kinase KdpD